MDKYIAGDMEAMETIKQFAKRIKMSGKSPLVNYLKSQFEVKQDTFYVLPLRQ